MEHNTTNNQNEKAKKGSIGAVIADHKAEFKKIVWPGREEVLKKTVTVIVTSLMLGVIIFCYDTVFTGAIDLAMGALGML